MKVKSARVHVVPCGNRRAVIIELETDTGLTGLGEAGMAYGAGTTAAAELAAEMIERFVIGEDASRIERIWNTIYDTAFWTKGGGAITFSALSAIEHALWDIKGKDLGAPVHSLMGGPVDDHVAVYANGWWIGCDDAKSYARAAAQTAARGFNALKLYPLGMADPITVVKHPVRRALDASAQRLVVERCKAIREAVGSDVAILLDFGGGLSHHQLMTILEAIEPLDIGFVEEPVDPALPEAMARVAARTSIPIAAGERTYTRYGFHALFSAGAISIAQPDVCNTGGLMETKKIAAMAEAYNLRVAPHNYGSPLATAISLHACAAISNPLILEIFPDFEKEPGYRPVIEEPFEAKTVDGKLAYPTGPGLGVKADRKSLEDTLWRAI
ncbi:mandelate racemase/muconate lactonizing enzyme family protein [Pelagibacterium flavum]|uniref:Mandelate racemase/muconate lactonizing enzyme family protein n=1 Tax=Pelagibacterium flavum TaxID=2984530 RepID=A0ABY6IJV4_9HYPH|nr:mandelate racemase/muconate lactonizing enzyme family protein [Pelagibacterium sp. YIM 151497]UYQ70894.1 mandelate racemase/muconate lactonizing enzyme family protein [Pelagibacterium sp. YIM 151497]